MKNILLEEEINNFRRLSGLLNEAAPGPATWVASLLSKITKKSLSDDVIKAFEPLVNSGKITIDGATKTIKSINWRSLTNDEVKLLFKSDEMVGLMDEVIKTNKIRTSKPAMQTYTGNFKKIMDGYVAGKAETRISSSGGSQAGSTGATIKPPKPTNPVNTFKIPEIDLDIPDFWKMDENATTAALKNIFPKASSSDLQKIVNNLNKMKLTDQAAFDIALKDAVKSFGPVYLEKINNPGYWSKVTSKYAALPKWGKIIFWFCATPVGYHLLKGLGVPVDTTLGSVIDGWKGIAKDQAASLKGDGQSTTPTPDQNQGQTYSFDDNGMLQWLSKAYPTTKIADYELTKMTTPFVGYGVKLKTGGDGKVYNFKYENGNYQKID
jgi:hypothetical protein